MFITETDNKEQQELKRKRVTSLANVFSRALSVLSGRKVNVNVVDDKATATPAWSSTHEVWLNLHAIKEDFTPRSLTSLNGLSFHELAHLKFSPRTGSTLVQLIQADEKSKKLWEAFNCLEDSRIENLLIALLPSVKGWITATIADYLLDDVSLIDRAFPLIYGRYYLPKDVRQLSSDKYKNQNDLAELKSIIDTYTSLIITSTNSQQAFELIKRFSELLDNLPPMPQNPNGDEDEEGTITVTIRVPSPNGHGKRPTEGYESSSNRPLSKQEQEKIMEQVNKNKDITIDITPKEDSQSSSANNSEPKNTQSGFPTKSGNEFDSNSDEFGDEFGDEFDDYLDNDFNDDFGSNTDSSNESPKDNQGHGIGDEEGDTGKNQQVTDALNDLLDEVVSDLSKELGNLAKQLGITDSDFDAGNATAPQRANYTEVSAPIELVELSRAFSRELERLRADYDPSWVRYRDTGKVNALRYFRGDDVDSIFDEWSEGRDDVTEIEAVILLDKSGSMEGENADNAYKSMFVLAKALERVNARTTVCVFDYTTKLLYGAGDKTTKIRDAGAGGGTEPTHALLYAKKILAETEKPIRILFTITDGAWDSVEGEQAITAMRNGGVLTCQALIGFGNYSKELLEGYRHGFELLAPIKSAKELTKLGKDLVRLAINRNLTNV